MTPANVENRTLVYSYHNKNPKIEVSGVRIVGDYGKSVPRPILIFERVEKSFFRYTLILSGQSGYAELASVLDAEPKHGLALRYKITNLDELLNIWAEYPH